MITKEGDKLRFAVCLRLLQLSAFGLRFNQNGNESLLLFRILLAGIFALAGIAKFLDLKGSEKAFTDFGVRRFLAMTGAVALSGG